MDNNSGKRIAFMSSLPPPSGGEANVTQTFFESLPALGYELYLVDVGPRDQRFFPGKFSLYNLGRLIRHFWILFVANITFRPAFVNLMFSYNAITKFVLFTLLSKMMGVRVIGQLHDPDVNREYELSSEARRTFIRWTFRLPDAWIVLGDVWEKFMLQAGVPKPIICIIPNAVKKEFASLAKSHIAPQESFPPVILFTGTVGYRKGIDLLLDALEALQAENATELAFKAELVGNGELQGEREALIEEFTKRLRPGSFEFVSHQEQQALIDRFIHASIFVLPSRAENLPIAMLEAMACALPVVVSRVGAVDEVIQDGKNGLLVGRERPTELKIALSTLLRFPDLRKRLGYNAQQTILRNHLSAEVGKKMDAFINYLEERL